MSSPHTVRVEATRKHLIGLLDKHGCITGAAEAAGMDRQNFKRMMRDCGIPRNYRMKGPHGSITKLHSSVEMS